MTEQTKFKCGRRVFTTSDEDYFREDDTCSYCGSLNPDTFMQRIKEGTVEVGPTDKGYKVYVKSLSAEQPFKHTYRIDHDDTGDQTKWVWITRDADNSKFYFQHLSDEQKTEFVELYNEKCMKVGYPGYLYTLPFFCK